MIACEELYLQQIQTIPRLTPEQENQLTARCAAGDPEAIRQLVDANLRLVVWVAKGYAGSGVPLLDLIQEGSIGLLVAARKFDPAKGCRFSTYATKWIRHGVTRCIMKHGGLIRVSQRTLEKAQKTQDTLPQVLSLDDAESQLLFEDLQAPQPQEELVRQELKNTVDGLLSRLTQRQRQVLRLRFGMEDGVCHTQESIGNILGISKQRARQIENEAVQKLQKLSAGSGLEDFLDP